MLKLNPIAPPHFAWLTKFASYHWNNGAECWKGCSKSHFSTPVAVNLGAREQSASHPSCHRFGKVLATLVDQRKTQSLIVPEAFFLQKNVLGKFSATSETFGKFGTSSLWIFLRNRNCSTLLEAQENLSRQSFGLGQNEKSCTHHFQNHSALPIPTLN